MSIQDKVTIWLTDAEMTRSAGGSLAGTIYRLPLSIWLHGELGAGKTTFLQGFFKEIGIEDHVTSPTYALEQRYQSARFGEVTHIDLYRLTQQQAEDLLLASDDHTGIRCIEWSERLGKEPEDGIHIRLQETDKGGRELSITFMDGVFPSHKQIEAWRKEFFLPSHIIAHCQAVADNAEKLAEYLLQNGVICRPHMLRSASEIHDLFRFVDFRPGASHVEETIDSKIEAEWKRIKAKNPDLKHEPFCAEFLEENGFPELARIVEVHGLKLPAPQRTTVEQKLLFYADKRTKLDELVSLEERFEDFEKRYGSTKESGNGKIWLDESKAIEQELFPKGVPF